MSRVRRLDTDRRSWGLGVQLVGGGGGGKSNLKPRLWRIRELKQELVLSTFSCACHHPLPTVRPESTCLCGLGGMVVLFAV
jgi:hypothetical protein